MIIYVDTSALVKCYVNEHRSEEVDSYIKSADWVGSSVLINVEMSAAIRKCFRQRLITGEEAQKAWDDFLSDWSSITRLNITGSTIDRAAPLAWNYDLRGYDAMHLACALFWQEALAEKITLATFDRDMWQAAKKANMETWPPDLVQ